MERCLYRALALKGCQSGAIDIGWRPAKTRDPHKRAVRFRTWPNRASAYLSATAITDDTSNEAERFVDAAEKEEMIMSTKSKMPSLVALAIVIATPAFAGQRTQPTKHESSAGELAFSVDPAGAQLNLVRPPTKNNLNGDHKPAVCLDIGISLDLPTRCWGHGL
jgi:hypothetical protein